jgi:NodT family efflux transporter outer membrane factor (OMF) lipoprotein
MIRKALYILGCGMLLSGCHLYTNYERPESVEAPNELYRDAALTEADTVSFAQTPWKEVFVDTILQKHIEKVLAQNPDMLKATLRMETAEEVLKIAKFAYIPSLAFTPQGQSSSFDWNKCSNTYTIPLTASWNLGNMGSLRNNLKTGKVTLEQSKVAKQAIQTALVSGVANLYFTLGMLDEQLKTSHETLKIWERNVVVMQAMKEAGMVNDVAVSQAKSNLLELRASIPQLQTSIRKVENSLCTLMGEAPHAIERAPFNSNGIAYTLKTGLPVQLLSNRADVRLQELNLANKFYGVNIARSAFYPSLNISATLGFTNNAGAMVINPGKFVFNAVASVVQPIFANGRLRANLKMSKNDYEAALIDFSQSLVTAGTEVSNALDAYRLAEEQLKLREEEVQILEKTVKNVNALFQHSNTTTYLETLTAQQSLLSAQLQLINDNYNKVQAAITLYQALGGGWQ